MCFVCSCVTVVASVEQRVNSGKNTATGMPSNDQSITADSWTSPLNIYECQDGPCKPESSPMNTNTDIWYDAIDDLAILTMNEKDFKLWPVADKHKEQKADSEDNSDNMQFYDAMDNLAPEKMECNSNGISEDTSSSDEGVCCNGAVSSEDSLNCRVSSESDFDWDDGFEFYFISNGDCGDSDSDCETDDEDFEEETFSDDEDDDNDFIVFEDSHTERTVSFKSLSPKSSYNCTDSKKNKKHVHFSPELVTVYVVPLGEGEGCRKSPWVQLAVDRMHFHHRIEQLERILTPCLLLKQKLGLQFLETMKCPSLLNKTTSV